MCLQPGRGDSSLDLSAHGRDGEKWLVSLKSSLMVKSEGGW